MRFGGYLRLQLLTVRFLLSEPLSWCGTACSPVNPTLLSNGPKCKGADAGDLNVRSCKVLPLREKIKVLNFIRIIYMPFAKISSKFLLMS